MILKRMSKVFVLTENESYAMCHFTDIIILRG